MGGFKDLRYFTDKQGKLTSVFFSGDKKEAKHPEKQKREYGYLRAQDRDKQQKDLESMRWESSACDNATDGRMD